MNVWINCTNCGYRFGTFIQRCPKCNAVNPHFKSPHKGEVGKKMAIGSVIGFGIIVLAAWYVFGFAFPNQIIIINNSTDSQADKLTTSPSICSNNTRNPNPSPQLNAVSSDPKIDELRQYTLKKINEDRAKSNLPPVALSSNAAAQAHAEDILKTRTLTHWTTDGMKPYMRYSLYCGTYYVAQNAAISYMQSGDQLNDLHLQLCKDGYAICNALDTHQSIDSLEYQMMYNDQACCNNRHRDNILDKSHTHVSIGIAYDVSTFAIVQNFENQYINWTLPVTYDQKSNTVSMKGVLGNNLRVQDINIFYDPIPTHQTYFENRNRTSYDDGTLTGIAVEPAPFGSYYKASNYTLIEASTWRINGNDFAITFSLDKLTEKNGDGVYTIMLIGKDDNSQNTLLTTTSIFKK